MANTNDNLHFFVHFMAWLDSVHVLFGKTMVTLHDIIKHFVYSFGTSSSI